VPDDTEAPLLPSDFSVRALPLVDASGPWVRLFQRGHDPLYFGRTRRNRFDDPTQGYGVLYAADTFDGAFIEIFGRSPGANTVDGGQLATRDMARIETLRALRLVDLTGPGLARIGATSALFAGPHAASRQWSRAMWSHAGTPDGLLYLSRHDPASFCVAIFDRAADAIRATAEGNVLADSHRVALGATLNRYRFSIQP